MTMFTLQENKIRIKKSINDEIDSQSQQTLIKSYQKQLGEILTECENMYTEKENSFVTSESYQIRSANSLLKGHNKPIEDLYDLHSTLHQMNSYNFPYDCDGFVDSAYRMLSHSLAKHIVIPEGDELTTTANIVQLMSVQSLVFDTQDEL